MIIKKMGGREQLLESTTDLTWEFGMDGLLIWPLIIIIENNLHVNGVEHAPHPSLYPVFFSPQDTCTLFLLGKKTFFPTDNAAT